MQVHASLIIAVSRYNIEARSWAKESAVSAEVEYYQAIRLKTHLEKYSEIHFV
jgi:hypothetical protein